MSDSDLFRQSRESQVVTRVLTEYTDLYPHVCDGLSLCVLNVKDLQTVIAGIDTFLKQRAKLKDAEVEEPGPPYHFSLTIFVGVNETQGISRWLQEWRRRWNAAQDNGKSAYAGCKLSISQRVVKDRNDYIHLLAREPFEADVALLPHFIDAGSAGNDVCTAMPYYSCWDYLLKFPIVEVPHCAEAHPAMACERSRIVSNRQFELPTLHAELSARFKHPGNPASHKYLVIRRGDYTPWMPIVDELHKRATWVVCLDSSIDEQLIRQNASSNAWKREIIGFSSGLGAHGELNYTVSTERSSLVDVERAIRDQVNGLFGPWRHEEIAKASHRLVQESRKLSGLSLVRATGPSQYVRDLIAYTLVRISLPELPARGVLLCDELLALDTFHHWFDTAESGERPDLLRLVVFLRENGRIEVAAQLIECKLAKQAEAHLQKAHEQLENGLRHLSKIFHPRRGRSGRFDQRFWWAQLQRLIASKSVVGPGISKQAVTATLETLGEGRFDISWQAAVVAFWTDSTSDRFTVEKKWEFESDIGNLAIEVISGGKGLVHRICCLGEAVCLPVPETMIFLKSEDSEEVEDVPITSSFGEEAAEETIAARSETSYSPEEVDIEAPAESEPVEMEEMEVQEPLATSITPPVFSEDPCIPGRILLGRSLKGSREVYWEFGHPELSNRHILLFGRSGSGKTYAIQALLCELGMKGQNSVIVDYTDGFEKAQLEQETLNILNPKQHFIYSQPLPINPFRRQLSSIGDEILPEKPNNTAQRVMSVFASVYSLGDQQKSLLYECIKDGIEVHGAEMNLERLIDLFHAYVSDGGRKETAISLLSKIKPFVDGDPFGKEDPESWLRFYDDRESRAHIIQLKGCGREFGCLVTEFALIDLYWFARASGDVRHPKVVVLDEIQNLDHSQESPIAKFLTEGRKFGLSMILATQTLRNLREDARHRLFQASHKLFFRPAETEVQEYAKILEATVGEGADLWRRRLTGLGKGECFSLGPSMNPQTGRLEDKAFAIKISALSERVRE
jgi:DNA phosphorothioation-dependent restriction protein DptH